MASDEPVMSVARQAWLFFTPLAVLAAIVAFFFWPAAVVLGVLALYVLYFFRDPRRTVTRIPGSFVSPADGKVVSVIEVPEPRMPNGRATRVAIFLNVFDVHLQRASQDGTVFDLERKPGRFMNALNEKCSEENEQLTIWLRNEESVFGIRQIAGAIARRIVCDVSPGDVLSRGQRYGLIMFGSRVELFLPTEVSVKVKPGQRVKGGETCLALLNEEDVRRGRTPSRAEVAMQKDLAGVR